jgi:hypothetical protein
MSFTRRENWTLLNIFLDNGEVPPSLETMSWEAVRSLLIGINVVFYCFAAILPVSGIYSIISLFISGLLLSVFRPILRENASAVPYNGGSYSYLVNFTSKSIAVVAAAITSLDAITTAVVSAGSAGGYLEGEITLPFPAPLLTVFILILFSCVCLFGIRESSRVALMIMAFHLATISIVALTSVVRWGMIGNSLLSENWATAQPGSAGAIAKQIFFGVSLGFLGNTGTTPSHSLFQHKLTLRFRINAKLRRRTPPRHIPQSPPKPLAPLLLPTNPHDAPRLGPRPLLRHPVPQCQHPLSPR